MKQPDLPLQGILPRKRGNSLVTQAQALQQNPAPSRAYRQAASQQLISVRRVLTRVQRIKDDHAHSLNPRRANRFSSDANLRLDGQRLRHSAP